MVDDRGGSGLILGSSWLRNRGRTAVVTYRSVRYSLVRVAGARRPGWGVPTRRAAFAPLRRQAV